MATKKKLLQAAAGAAGGAGLNVEDVFSTYLYDGNATSQTITNGIDLAGEGGLTWIKCRSFATSNYLFDTERGIGDYIKSDSTSSSATNLLYLDGFNSDGFSVRSSGEVNEGGRTYASWTFRKAPKFFDVVTYTGTGSAQTISHNLGSVPAVVIVKMTSGVGGWFVYHSSVGATKYLRLETTGSQLTNSTIWNNTAPTDTQFTVGTSGGVNQSGGTYVAYLFAHNDGDGEFGDGTQDIIKCGSYTGNGSTDGPEIDLGFEPQWVMVKVASGATSNWGIFDNMRGITNDEDPALFPDDSSDEVGVSTMRLTPTGFKITRATNFENGNGNTYIYIAIRRGPMAVPESATDVFQVGTVQNNTPKDVSPASDFPVDFVLHHAAANSSTGNKLAINRLANDLLYTNLTGSYGTYSSYSPFDHMDNVQLTGLGAANGAAWMWKRAPSFFDVVAYTGNNSSNNHHAINHNLGVAPEMIWFKRRDSTGGWGVLVTALGTVDSGGVQVGQGAYLNESSAFAASGWWGSPYVAPTATEFTVRSDTPNASGGKYIAYLFASLDGVSKVGSYTGNGSSNGDSQNIDCGFSSGARFVLIKRTDISSNWLVFDSTRGIVAGNDPVLALNNTNAEYTTTDEIDPYSAGFAVTVDLTGFATNVSGASYIFYAIA